jgi:hypothetical protein
VADLVQALLEKQNQATTEIQSKDEKIQALTFELAYLRRIRYGVKSEAFSQLQWDLNPASPKSQGPSLYLCPDANS